MTIDNTSIPSDAASGIFINYRREDTAGHAGRLHDVLDNRFRGSVFMDIDKIEAGQDFVEVIDDALSKCKVLLVMIGRQWFSVTNSDGRRRLDNPEDFVRREVAAALVRNIKVIPILVEGAGMPRQEDLPEELKKLSRLNAMEISDTRWAYDVGRLIEVLKKHVQEREAGTAEVAETAAHGGRAKETTRQRMKVALVIGIIALTAIGVTGGFLLSRRQNTPTNTNRSATPAQLSETELKEINQALELVGRCISAADVMLRMLTSPDYDPRNFPNDKKAQDSIEKQVGEATDKYNQADEDWKTAKYKLDLLMSRHSEVEASWQNSQKTVTAYMDCVSDLEQAKGNGEPIDRFQGCTDKKQAVEDHLNELKNRLVAARR